MNLQLITMTAASGQSPGFWQRLYAAAFGPGVWELYFEGIKNTLIITVLALVLGIVIGIAIAVVKYINQTSGKLKVLNGFASLYTTVIRGTPVMIQILIFYNIIFTNAPREMALLIAGLSFGINSGAYVSEIIRGGIMSVDTGQSETGRSLGLSQGKTMRLIILPQAIRGILPSLFNEFISLLKETSIAGSIAVMDITGAADYVRSRTWGFEPLIVSACIYLVFVLCLTQVQKVLERRLSLGDRRK